MPEEQQDPKSEDSKSKRGGTSEIRKSKFVNVRKIVLIVSVCVLGLCAFAYVNGVHPPIEPAEDNSGWARNQMSRMKQKIVYAIKDIPEGATISSDALEEREIEASKVPEGAVASSTLVVGYVAKYGISAGQIILFHDVQLHSALPKGAKSVKKTFKHH